ncbi:MAG: acylphosphatase [Candidatus Aquicultorales bacterium]
MRRRTRVLVRGRVQGVYFRAYTRQEAERLGIGGWVRNTPDGNVEAAFEGDEKAVDRMLEIVRSGPPAAEVATVDVTEEEPVGEVRFSIR